MIETLTLTFILLLGENNVGPTFWKWVPHEVVGLTLISPNKKVSARASVEKSVSSNHINKANFININIVDY